LRKTIAREGTRTLRIGMWTPSNSTIVRFCRRRH
jgi:hypothetical protein